jgi:mRNA interferase RelE/StbE
LAWRIELTASAVKQLGKLDKSEAKRITSFLRERLAPAEDPRSVGKALKGSQFGTYWRYRLGDYRIICDSRDKALLILVVAIANRRDAYR